MSFVLIHGNTCVYYYIVRSEKYIIIMTSKQIWDVQCDIHVHIYYLAIHTIMSKNDEYSRGHTPRIVFTSSGHTRS